MASLDELQQVFFQECEEQLEELTDGLSELEMISSGEIPDPEIVNRMFRAVHSIKGGAASFSLDAITQYAHVYETILDELRSGKLELNRDNIPFFYRAADRLADFVSLGAAGKTPDGDALAADIAEITALSSSSEVIGMERQADDFLAAFAPVMLEIGGDLPLDPGPHEVGYSICFTPTAELYANGHEPVQLFRELSTLGPLTVEADLPTDQHWDAPTPSVSWQLSLVTEHSEAEIEEIFEFAGAFATVEITRLDISSNGAASIEVCPATFSENPDQPAIAAPADRPESTEIVTKTAAKKQHQASGGSKATVRVDLELVDDLINLVGELVITQSVMTQSINESEITIGRQLATTLEDFKALTRTIQEGVMAIRAQSVKPLFQRMGRIVRETAQIAGKDVRFIIVGEDTEVDRTVIERLVDPLTHILRNAVDHGLENADRRREAGKDETGSVTLSAAHRSGRVVIEITDDGGGVNRERVLESAIAKGLVPENAKLGDAEIDRLLFMPGFSTAESVTKLSGRGVGMDVVNSEIRRLGGRVAILSTPGKGTTISISLPLTLAVLDGMVVDVAEQTMVVPISAIVETIRPDLSQLHLIGPSAWMIAVRDVMVPVIQLSAIFGYTEERAIQQDSIVIIVEDDKGEQFALAVDQIRDQRQVVIKSLEANYGHVPYVAAATILGDGQIALIVDLDEITQQIPTAVATSLPPTRAIA